MTTGKFHIQQQFLFQTMKNNLPLEPLWKWCYLQSFKWLWKVLQFKKFSTNAIVLTKRIFCHPLARYVAGKFSYSVVNFSHVLMQKYLPLEPHWKWRLKPHIGFEKYCSLKHFLQKQFYRLGWYFAIFYIGMRLENFHIQWQIIFHAKMLADQKFTFFASPTWESGWNRPNHNLSFFWP